jgi:hypothetical protein
MKASRQLLMVVASAGLLACAPLEGGSESASPEQELGSQESAILNGTPVAPNSEPWSVRILKAGVTSCTGTLIDPQWVLTAAHCVQGPGIGLANISVVVGDQTSSTDDTDQSQPAAQLIPHPAYDAAKTLNDIGLIRLANPFEINAFVQTAQVATDTPSVGTYAVGWGWIDAQKSRPAIMRRGTLSVLPSNQCDPVPSTQFCASGGTSTRPISVCPGDSGGPLLTYGRRNVVGVASYTWDLCGGSKPSYYTRVSSYRSWILSQIGYDPRRDVRMTYSGADAAGWIYLYCDATQKSVWASTSVYGSELSIDCPDSWVWMECDITSEPNLSRSIQAIQRQVGLGEVQVVDNTQSRKSQWYYHAAGEIGAYDCHIN